jgi:hypothetical protein
LVGTVALGETVAEVGRHAVVEAGIIQLHGHGVLESMRQQTASAACRSERPSRNWSPQTVVS